MTVWSIRGCARFLNPWKHMRVGPRADKTIVNGRCKQGPHRSPRPVSHRPPGPEACGLPYLLEYKENIFAKYFILSTKSTLVGGQLGGVILVLFGSSDRSEWRSATG